MKKILLILLSLSFLVFSCVNVLADDSLTVYVSISNGTLVVAYEKLSVTDIDNDGVISINDALYLAHDLKFDGGAEKGYASSMGAYGLKIDKLWGVDNGDSYGYYVNNVSAMSLGDALKNGDHVYAFLYTDLVAWSDTFSCFDKCTLTLNENESAELTLTYMGFDENWNTVVNPVKDAVLTINGVESTLKTDDEGKVVFSADKKGEYIISAKSADLNLVPPVCVVSVKEKEIKPIEPSKPVEPAKPGDSGIALFVALSFISAFSLFCLVANNRKNEK